MSQTIKITDDVSIVLSDRLLGTLVVVPPKAGKRNRYRRLAVMRHNLIKSAQVLTREGRRHKPYLNIEANLYKDISK